MINMRGVTVIRGVASSHIKPHINPCACVSRCMLPSCGQSKANSQNAPYHPFFPAHCSAP
jgi:hypothetical protein